MMSCRDVGARLVAFLRGELSFPDRLSVHRHLAHCAECNRQVETGRDALNVSKSALRAAADPVPDEVPEQLVRAIWSACHCAR